MAKLSSVIVFVNPQVFDEMENEVRWNERAAETDFLQQREEATILLLKKSIKDSSWYNGVQESGFLLLMENTSDLIFLIDTSSS